MSTHDSPMERQPELGKAPEAGNDNFSRMPGGLGLDRMTRPTSSDNFALTYPADRHVALTALENKNPLAYKADNPSDPVSGAMQTAFAERFQPKPYDSSYGRPMPPTDHQSHPAPTDRQPHGRPMSTHMSERLNSLKTMLRQTS